MSTNLIVVLSVLGAAALVGVFYFSHAIEKQRRQKALLIANLNDYVFRIQRLLDEIHENYLPNELHLLLLNQLKKRVERLHKLASARDKYSKRLESVNSQINELQTRVKTPPPRLKTPEEANKLKLALQDLSKIIENLVRNSTIPPEEGNRHMQSVQFSYLEANIQYLMHTAQTAVQDDKPRLAVLNYEKALAEMAVVNTDGRYSESIAEVAELIQDLNNRATSQQTEKVDDEDNGSELNKAVENLIEDDHSWKKKYF